MFPRSRRVSREQFPKILSSRTRVSSPHFSATLAGSPAGVAVVVAKKVEKTSVGRHKLKRRILGVLRAMEPLPRAGVIVFARAGASSLSSGELRTEIKSLLV